MSISKDSYIIQFRYKVRMVTATIIVNKYAQAAFNVAKKDGLVEQFLTDLKLFSDNFSAQICKELSNPTISKTILVDIINHFAKKLSINKKVTSFLIIIAGARRISLSRQIYDNFLKLAKLDKKILEVELVVTKNLKEKQLETVKSLLKQKYPTNIIEVTQIIQKDILGGIMIKIGSEIIDATVKNQLANIINECKSAVS